MCRLYGFAATQPTRLECSLVAAQNALQVQSDRDGRGRRNADGWGIARWSSEGADVVRSTPELLKQAHQAPAGTTDSELIFQWILGRMSDYGLDPDRPADDVEPVALLVEQVVLDLVRASIAIPQAGPSKLNFLLTDGKNLVASRWGNTLYWTERDGVRDCAVCGTDHCPEADASYKAVVIASEPITDERWTEVEEGTIIAVDGAARLSIYDLATRAA